MLRGGACFGQLDRGGLDWCETGAAWLALPGVKAAHITPHGRQARPHAIPCQLQRIPWRLCRLCFQFCHVLVPVIKLHL